MRQFTIIIEQIEQSKNLIVRNDTASLRMALILLDNAAEILMYRRVLSELRYNEFYGRLREQARSSLPSDLFDEFLTEHTMPEILGKKCKRKILKYFDEKKTFLCDTSGLIPSPVGSVLSSLHKYRNEIYHRDIIRNEILRPIAILYFELVCELVIYLQQSANSYSSGDDWSHFFAKYGLGEDPYKMRILDDKDIEVILNKFRAELLITFQELAETLQEYVINRLDEALDRLAFISESLGIKAPNNTLKLIQFTQTDQSLQFNNRNLLLLSKEFSEYTAPITEEVFSVWQTKAQHFADHEDKLALFIAFKSLEDEFEPVEHRIYDVADELDAAIQLAIDLARGK